MAYIMAQPGATSLFHNTWKKDIQRFRRKRMLKEGKKEETGKKKLFNITGRVTLNTPMKFSGDNQNQQLFCPQKGVETNTTGQVAKASKTGTNIETGISPAPTPYIETVFKGLTKELP